MNRLRERLGTVVVVLGVGVSSGAAFVSNVAVPWALPPREAGDYFIVASASTLASALLRFGVDRSIVRTVGVARGADGTQRALTIARSASLWAMCLAVLTLLILALAIWPFLSIHIYHAPELEALRWPIAVFLACEAARMIASEPLRGLGMQVSATFLGDAGRGTAFASVVLLAAVSNRGNLSLICVLAAACSAFFLVASFAFTWTATRISSLGHREVISGIRPVLVSSAPFFLTAISAIAVAQGDVLIGGVILGRADLAHYAAASKLALVLGLPITATNLAVAPRVSTLWARGQLDALEEVVRKFAAFFALFILPVCIVMMIFAAPLLDFLFPSGYVSSAPVLAILIAGSVVVLVTGPNGYVLLMTDGRRFVAVTAIITAVLQVGAMVVCARLGGPVGLALASTAGTAGMNAVLWWRVSRVTGVRTDIGLTPWRLLVRTTPVEPVSRSST